MKQLYFMLLNILLGTSILLASSKCPNCKFENENNERYCLNCMTEISPISEKEKQRLETINQKRNAKVEKHLKTQLLRPNATKISLISKGETIELEEHAVRGGITIFDFYAKWCRPCRRLTPKLEKLIADTPNVYLRKIDIKNWKSPIAKKYGINSIPSIWIYDKKCSKAYERLNGINNIKNAIETLQ